MDHALAARRITRTLFLAQSLGSAGQVAIFPIVAILGAQLSGRPSWAGVPSTVYLLASAFSAFGWGHAMDRIGRRRTLVTGLLLGTVAGTLGVTAVLLRSLGVFLLGATFTGFAVSCLTLSRFVSAEVHPPSERARAISNVVLGGTVGAVVGPLMAGPVARLVRAAGYDELAGPFAVMLILFALGALVIYAWLRPEPKDLAQAIGSTDVLHMPTGPARRIGEILRDRAVVVAMTAMVFGQLVMVMLMVITPLHMRGHDHALSSISFVISTHVVGMYAFSVISGRLADRWGRPPVIVAGGAVLILACFSATLSPQVLPMSTALFLLGLGWNFCFVAGSSLLADRLSPPERARTQGFNDLLIGLVSAAGGLSSGIVFAAIGYGAMALVGAAAAIIPLSLAAWWSVRSRALPAGVGAAK
jgi:MFS family permease